MEHASRAWNDGGTRRVRFDAPRTPTGAMLVSDQARERAVRNLKRAYLRGRVDGDELEVRTTKALAARTRADLWAITGDIPQRRRRSRWRFVSPVWMWRIAGRLLRRGRRRLRHRRLGELPHRR